MQNIIHTKGVVLAILPYNDRTQFVHIYTEATGKITCRVKATPRSRRAAVRNYFTPLTLLEMVIENKSNSELFDIVEASLLSSPYLLSAAYDPGKSAQCLFMAELLDKTIREVEANPRLWHFIEQSIEALPLIEEGSANYHLLFTTKLCYLLGFHVDTEIYEPGMLFDVSEGLFRRGPINHPYYLNAQSAAWLHLLLCTSFSDIATLQLNHKQRNILLNMMLQFLRIHLPDAGDLRSVEVLKDLFT
ncbi:MAG: DNA repair protein RecO [Bacteroidales bacterium]|nr:DNA repair protein RecO [Bacteroidales bacterium]